MEAGTILVLDVGKEETSAPLAAQLTEMLFDRGEIVSRKVSSAAGWEDLLEGASAEAVFLVGRIVDLLACRQSVKKAARVPEAAALVAVPLGADCDQLMNLLRWGVNDFIQPPLTAADVLARLERCRRRFTPDDPLLEELTLGMGLRRLVGRSRPFLKFLRQIPLVARCDATLLISGETGTGKELCARAVHYSSPRCNGPFVPVNCGAIPVELVENELFGHERMAYTGANESSKGLVEEARRGTLFLDEIDSLPKRAQVKLLRLLQEKEYRRLGSSTTRRAQVRVIAATNQPPRKAVRRGQLREDLYYRLSALPLKLPPLRRRREDIPELARYFLAQFAADFGKEPPRLSNDAAHRLCLYDWPGNIRELENVIKRAVVFCDSSRLKACDLDLPEVPPGDQAEPFKQAKLRVVARFERDYVESLLTACRGNISQAARKAQKNRRAFFELIRKHGIDVQRFRT